MWFLQSTRTFVRGYGCSLELQHYRTSRLRLQQLKDLGCKHEEKKRSGYWRVHKCDRWWQDVDFSTKPSLFLAGMMCRQSHLALLSSHMRLVLREKCVSAKKKKRKKRGTLRKTESGVVGDEGGFQRRRSTFWDRGVRFSRGEVCFPRGTTTFHLNISKMLFRPSSERPPPPFAISTLICLSQSNKISLFSKDSYCSIPPVWSRDRKSHYW